MRLPKQLPLPLVCFLMEETGASFIEYALLGLLVAVVSLLSALAMGKSG